MNNTNELVKIMLSALSMPRNDKIPSGWFRRRDVERVMDCSEPQAIRHIRGLQKIEGFKVKNFWIEGKKVPFYRVDAPSPVSWSEHVGDFEQKAPTGEQTNPTKPSEREETFEPFDPNCNKF